MKEYTMSKDDLDVLLGCNPEDETAPKTWGEMSDAEKGELLPCIVGIKPDLGASSREPSIRESLIHYYRQAFDKDRAEELAKDYLKALTTEPKRETVEMVWGYTTGGREGYAHPVNREATHKITFETVDGVPVLDSIKMEEV